MPPTESDLRAAIVKAGRMMQVREYVDGSAGNLSIRLDPNRILATPSGMVKGELAPDDLIIVDMNGQLVSGRPGLRPTSELAMHLEAYRRRPDVNAVVHAHPITAVALSIAGISMEECVIPEAIVFLGLVPTTPYATPSSDENRRAISEVITGHDALILRYHGSLTVGRDMQEAYLRLETLEHTAKIIALTRLLGGGPPLPPEQVTKLLKTRQDWGLARPNDPNDFCVACGVCHLPGQHLAPSETPRPAWDDTAVSAEDRLVKEIAAKVRAELNLGR
jgi:L-fuculose-phosphate aldolase